jgi:hypothetical protein
MKVRKTTEVAEIWVEKVVHIDLELLQAGQSGDSFSTSRTISS